MDNSFFAYLQQLELLVFFSGYPLLYLLIRSLGNIEFINSDFKKRVNTILPYTYAFAGLLFLGFELKNLYPDYSFDNIYLHFQKPFWFGWAILSVLFWIPLINKMPILSFLHSLFFFYLFVKGFSKNASETNADHSLMVNNMRVYTISLLLYVLLLIVFYFLSFLIARFSKKHSH
jgi:hypothetical protein